MPTANELFYTQVADLLKQWGFDVDYYSGWKTRTNGTPIMPPTAVTMHHTGGVATATSYLSFPPDRPQLKVLANVHIRRDHKVVFVAAGTASHGGYTYKPCWDRIVAGSAPLDRDLVPGPDSSTFSINRYTVGVEVDGAGGADEWDNWMKQAVIAFCVASERIAGWSKAGESPRVGAHKEHTRRKPGDPYMNMGTLRSVVQGYLESGEPVLAPGVVDPVDPTTQDVNFRVGSYNAQLRRFGGGPYSADAKFTHDVLNASILFGQEMEESCRDAVRVANDYVVWANRTVATFWDPKKYDYGESIEVDFGSTTNRYHGLIGRVLTSRVNKRSMAVASVHIRASDAIPGTDAQKLAAKKVDVGKVIQALAKYSRVVVGGDWNTRRARDWMLAAGFVQATPNLGTTDGGKRLDAIFVRDLSLRSGGSIRATSASDHHGLIANPTLPGKRPDTN